jgi:hypothetical protein
MLPKAKALALTGKPRATKPARLVGALWAESIRIRLNTSRHCDGEHSEAGSNSGANAWSRLPWIATALKRLAMTNPFNRIWCNSRVIE